MIRVLVADAQRLMAESLRAGLALEPDLEVLPATPESGLEAVEAVIRSTPDVAVLDYWMEGMAGHAAARLILHRFPECRILLLGWFHGPPEMQEAARSGAVALLSKELHITALAEAIRLVAESLSLRALETLSDTSLSAVGPTPSEPAPEEEDTWRRLVTLTPREIEILGRLAARGRPEDVAKELSLTLKTVRLHIEHILFKTKARSHVEAVLMARERGLI